MNTKPSRGPTRNRDGHAKRHRSPAGLSARRLRFIDEYMTDRNATQAALRAGYSKVFASAKSWTLLRIPAVADELNRRIAVASEKADVDATDIIRDLKRIAFFDIGTLFDENGHLVTDPAKLDENTRRGLVSAEIIVLNREGDYIVKLQPGNRLRAIEMLGKFLGMFGDRVEVDRHTTVKFTTDFGTADESAAPM